MTRTITGTILKPDGSAHYEASVLFDMQTVLATTSTESVIQQQVTATTDESGAYSAALAVPESGSWRWRVTLPDGNAALFWLADGDATTMEAILLAASLAGEPGAADTLAALIAVHNAATTSVHGIADTSALVADDDARLTDARTPTAHAASHATGQSDAIAAVDIGAEPAITGGTATQVINGLKNLVEGVWLNVAQTWTAVQTFSSGIVTGTIKPAADSTAAVQITKADGTPVLTIDTTNSEITIGSVPAILRIGSEAGRGATSTSQISIGAYAGKANQGTYAVQIGQNAGENNTNPNQIAIGRSAGKNNTASGQVAIGVSAGFANSGLDSLAFGATAGFQNTGDYLVALGGNAGQYNSGVSCTFVGRGVGVSNTTNYRVAIGNNNGSLLDGIKSTTVSNSSLTVNAGALIFPAPVVPASAAATGTTGQISWDANCIYICTATNTWKRVAIATW